MSRTVLPRDAMPKRNLCRSAVSICPSDRLSRSCSLSKVINVGPIFNFCIILVFSMPYVVAIFQRGPLTRESNAGGVGKNRDSRPVYMASSRIVNGVTAKCYTHNCAGRWQVGDSR